jgi:DNA-dependent metalloprotease WSS1
VFFNQVSLPTDVYKKFIWQAAERRVQDEKSCASGLVAQREAEKAAKQSNVIDLTLDDNDMYDFDSDSDVVIVEDTHRKPPGSSAIVGPSSVPQSRSNPSGRSNANKPHINYHTNTSSKNPIQKTSSLPQAELVEWSCQACTLLNPYTALQCGACDMRRPPDERVGWTCFACDQPGHSHDFWVCWRCGTMKLQS